MIHSIAWKTGRLRILILPYITVGVPAFILLCAIISLLEMLQFLNHAVAGEYDMTLFFMTVDTASAWSWIVTILVAASAGCLVRMWIPRLRDAWASANAPLERTET